MKAFKFSNMAQPHKPDTAITKFVEHVQSGAVLSRDEKNKIAGICYGTFGSGFAGYKIAGWQWTLRGVLNEYIVEFKYGRFQAYFTPDKTSLRKALSNYQVMRIIAVK